MKSLVIFFFISLSINMNAQSNVKLVYYGDPMCSWCYGIAPELEKIVDGLDENIEFEVVQGGLRPYNKQTMLDLKSFLTEHWQEVHHRSGQAFNYDILNSSTITYDTEPPARASIVVRELAPEKEFVFFKMVQTAFYLENKNLHLAESYHAILNELDINIEQFEQLFHSDQMKAAIKEDYIRASEMGVRGFPTLMLESNGEVFLLANGYTTAEKVNKRIQEILSK